MWTQDYLSAPWVRGDLFTQLNTNLTLAGWVSYEDQTADATYPYIIYRNNIGVGRDILLYIDLTQSTNNVNHQTIRMFAFEKAAYTDGTGTIPNNIYHGIGQDLDTTANLLVNHGNTPNNKNLTIWFEQSGNVFPPFTLLSIEPYLQDDGITLVNSGDDGSSYPLWGGLHMGWSVNSMVGGAYFDRSNINFSFYFDYIDTNLPRPKTEFVDHPLTWNNGFATNDYFGVGFSAPRMPVTEPYAIIPRGAHFVGRDEGTYLTLPNKRIVEWSGGATFVEGFRPEILGAVVSGASKYADPRGYLGEPGDVLVTRAFGGALADSFTSNGNTYRIVYSLNQGTGAFDVLFDMAIRVA